MGKNETGMKEMPHEVYIIHIVGLHNHYAFSDSSDDAVRFVTAMGRIACRGLVCGLRSTNPAPDKTNRRR
jgi:hypothetical protein